MTELNRIMILHMIHMMQWMAGTNSVDFLCDDHLFRLRRQSNCPGQWELWNRWESIEIINLRLSRVWTLRLFQVVTFFFEDWGHTELTRYAPLMLSPTCRRHSLRTLKEMLILLDLFRSIVGSNEIKVWLDLVAKPKQWNNIFAGLHRRVNLWSHLTWSFLLFRFSRVGWATAASSPGDLFPRWNYFFLTEFRVPHLLWFYFAPTEFNLQLLFWLSTRMHAKDLSIPPRSDRGILLFCQEDAACCLLFKALSGIKRFEVIIWLEFRSLRVALQPPATLLQASKHVGVSWPWITTTKTLSW